MPVMSLPVPCIRGEHGPDLLIFQTAVGPADLEQFLGHDPRHENWRQLPQQVRDLYEYIQRKTSTQRRFGTAEYTEHRFGPHHFHIGGFPAISIGMTSPARFTPYGEAFDPDAGTVHIDLSSRNTRILLDGLARVSGVLDKYDANPDAYTRGFTFAVTLFAPREEKGSLSIVELGQLFHDMNFKQKSVTTAHALALDRSDLYTILTNEIGTSSVIKAAGGMELRSASLGKKSTAIVVQQVLRRFLRGACEGKAVQMDDKRTPAHPNLTPETRVHFGREIEALLGGLHARMGDRFKDRSGIHLSSAGWQAVGLIFHDILVRLKNNLTTDERDTILTAVANLDWTRHNPDWIPLLGQPETDDQGQSILDDKGRPRVALTRGGRQTVWALADYMRQHSLLQQLLASRAKPEDETREPELELDAA